MPRMWMLRLPHQPYLTLNQRLHWTARRERTEGWRGAAFGLAREQRIPPLQRIEVELRVQPGDRRKRDRHNLHATLKPCLDGLVDAKVIPDDTPEHVASEQVVLLAPSSTWEWTLAIREAP